jgi:hypothetical protein
MPTVDLSVWTRISDFGWALLGYWWVLVPGGVLAVEPMIEGLFPSKFKAKADRWWPKSRRHHHFRWASIIATLVAFFLAFDEVNTKNYAAKRELVKIEGERDEARRQSASPTQQSTINRLSGDLTAARGQIDEQRRLIEAQQAQISAQKTELEKLQPKPDRHLTEKDKENLARLFTAIKSEFPTLRIAAISSDGDAQGYAREFMTEFNKIGIRVDRVEIVFPASPVHSQLMIAVMDYQKIPSKAEAFAKAMGDAGFSIDGSRYENLPEDQFIFVVGSQR